MKIFHLLPALIVLLGTLASCSGSNSGKNAPLKTLVFSGNTEMEVHAGVVITNSDLIEGVTAADSKGNGYPVGVVNRGGLNTSSEGTYTIVLGALEDGFFMKKNETDLWLCERQVRVLSSLADISFDVNIEQDTFYDLFLTSEQPVKFSEVGNTDNFKVDNSYSTKLIITQEQDGGIYLGTRYLNQGKHAIHFDFGGNIPSSFKNASLNLTATEIFEEHRLLKAETWIQALYNDNAAQNFHGWVEAEGWQDMWTHCQYLPQSMILASQYGKTYLNAYIKNSADHFLIGKIYSQNDGSAYTIYRAISNVYQVSIEESMPTDKLELWRGQAAFIEEMLNCYLYFNETQYLDYAKAAAEYVLEKWSTSTISGMTGSYYTKYSDSPNTAIEMMSTGRFVMVLCQLYHLTNLTKYRTAAVQQGEI